MNTKTSRPSVFDGDGRFRVAPINAPEGTRPMAVTRSQARRIIQAEGNRPAFHSSAGGTVWVLVTHYLEQGIPFDVEPQFLDGERMGFVVRPRVSDSQS